MSESIVKCEIDGSLNASNLFHRRVSEFKDYITKQLPLWREILYTCFLISLYLSLCLVRNDYDQWVWRQWTSVWSLDVCAILIKFLIAAAVGLKLRNKQKSVKLSSRNVILIVAPPGIAYALAMGFSNWGLEWLSVSSYIMTKSTTILFIFFFALLFRLEEGSWFLLGIVTMISGGLATLVYHESAAISTVGIVLGLLGASANALRWTAVQYAMQKFKLGLEHPINMIYYIQPWMLLGMIPIAVWLEGSTLFNDFQQNWEGVGAVVALFGKGVLAFCLEFVEFMIILRTSSLSLFVAEISKILWTKILTDGYGLHMSDPNFLGLHICVAGIVLYIISKLWKATDKANEESTVMCNPDVEGNLLIANKTGISTIDGIFDKENPKYQNLK